MPKKFEIEIRSDSLADVSEQEALSFVERHMPLMVAKAAIPFHFVDGDTDQEVLLKGLGTYLVGAQDEDVLILSPAEKPGKWITFRTEKVRVQVCGPGFRVVDIYLYVVPMHDSHSRFGKCVYEMYTRLRA